MLPALLVLGLLSQTAAGYPVCVVVEGAGDLAPEVTCYDTRDVRGWRFCSDEEARPPRGLFVNFEQPFRYVGLRDCGGMWCPGPVVTGYAHRKEVVVNDSGVAIATGLITRSAEIQDGFEPLDRFATSSCSFSLVL